MKVLSISWGLYYVNNYRFVCIQQSQFPFELHGNMLLMHANESVCQLAWQQRKDTECVQRHGVSFISLFIKYKKRNMPCKSNIKISMYSIMFFH